MFFLFDLIGRLLYGSEAYEELRRRSQKRPTKRRK